MYNYIPWTKKDASIECTGFRTQMVTTWGNGASASIPGMVFCTATDDSSESIVI